MFPFFTKQEREVDAQEAFNLWDSLRTRYDTLETAQIHGNFIHDKDFKVLSEQIIRRLLEKQINEIENKMNEYSLSLPNRPPKSTRTPVNIEAFQDRFIALIYFDLIQSYITMDIHSIWVSLTNDTIREMYYRFLKEEVELYNIILQYAKMKGWLGVTYKQPNMPYGVDGELSSTEVFHIWNHLTVRYDAIQLTQIFSNFAHDPEFKVILNSGLKTSLEKQVNILEGKMNHFGLPLPQRPAKSVNTTLNFEIFEDEIMFRNLFTHIQYMLILHAIGLKQSTTNDPIREMFCDFLFEELNLFDKLVKYGKAKGWLRPVPMFKS